MSESADTRDLCREVEALGMPTYPLVAHKRAPPGWPDRLVCMPGLNLLVEFKSATGRLRPDQVGVLKRLDRARAPYLVARFDGTGDLLFEDRSGTFLGRCDGTGRAFVLWVREWWDGRGEAGASGVRGVRGSDGG